VDEVELFKGIATKFILVYGSRNGGLNSRALWRIDAVRRRTLWPGDCFLPWNATRMSMKLLDIPFCRRRLDFGDFGYVVFIIEAVSQHVAEVSQRSFQRVRNGLLFSLFKSSRLARGVLNFAVANVLRKSARSRKEMQVEPRGMFRLAE
jgi:hypothetical protein